MLAALPFPLSDPADSQPLPLAALGSASEFSPAESDQIMQRIRERGDRIVGRCLLLHALLAFILAYHYSTWLVTVVTTVGALGMFGLSRSLLPGAPLTRAIAGLSLQTFVALHIYQMHGLAEMHFFFFVGTTVLIVYQDARCFWLGTVGIILQHLVFALLHNSGVRVFFFEQSYVHVMKLVFHFGIVTAHVCVCSYWALLMKRQTLESVARNRQLQQTNAQLRTEMAERKQAQEAFQRAQDHYLRVSANVPGMVYQFRRSAGDAFDFPYVSEGCREMFAVDPADGMQDSASILSRVHPEDNPALHECIARSAADLSPCRWEGRLVLGETIKWIRSSSRPAAQPDGSIVWDGVLIDITDSKAAEVALRAAKEEAERANHAKSEFISRMSHELRTPLNAILGFGQLLARRELPPREQEGVGHIIKAGKHLLGLINEVLEIARIEAGHMELSIEPVEIRPLVEEVLSLIKPLARARDISLRVLVPEHRGDLHALADLQRLKQVLLNLLSNAVKYNVHAGVVSISWDTHEEASGTWLRLSIRDTGRGIEAGKLGLLFQPFERLGAENEGIEGSGIGLALTRRLMEMMKGTVGVHSIRGEGSTFFIDLPLAHSPTLPPVRLPEFGTEWQPVPATPDGREQIVLQIEDNDANRKVIEHVVDMRGGIQLISAQQGGLGLDLAREHRPALILLDLNLPDLSGAEILTRLLAHPETAHIPVIVLSADATAHQIQRLLALGAYDYLTKPIDIGRLLELMDETLRVAEAANA